MSNFKGDLEQAAEGKLDSWDQGYSGLAAVILMDQFSRYPSPFKLQKLATEFWSSSWLSPPIAHPALCRNIYRGSAKMYALDNKANNLAKRIHVSFV